MKISLFAVLAVLLGCSTPKQRLLDDEVLAQNYEPKIIGYYYHGSAKYGYTPDKIPTHKLTHVIYAFAEASEDGKCAILSDTPQIQKRNLENLKQIKNLKGKNKRLKVMVSIGGHGHSTYISDAVASESAREKFVKSCVEFLKKYNFDGIDMDWESPVSGGKAGTRHRPEDKENLVHVLREFRKQLPKGSLLSAAIGADEWSFKKHDILGMAPFLDWFGLMMYDYCEPKSKRTCHHSLLKNIEYTDNGTQSIEWLINQGIPKSQMVLGVPFYGYVWKVDSLENDGYNQIVVRTDEITEWDISYSEIKNKYLKEGFIEKWDNSAEAPYLINPQKNLFISYDNPRSLELKANHVRDNRFGGMMIWELSGDQKEESLLESINREIRKD